MGMREDDSIGEKGLINLFCEGMRVACDFLFGSVCGFDEGDGLIEGIIFVEGGDFSDRF